MRAEIHDRAQLNMHSRGSKSHISVLYACKLAGASDLFSAAAAGADAHLNPGTETRAEPPSARPPIRGMCITGPFADSAGGGGRRGAGGSTLSGSGLPGMWQAGSV